MSGANSLAMGITTDLKVGEWSIKIIHKNSEYFSVNVEDT